MPGELKAIVECHGLHEPFDRHHGGYDCVCDAASMASFYFAHQGEARLALDQPELCKFVVLTDDRVAFPMIDCVAAVDARTAFFGPDTVWQLAASRSP